MRTRSLVIAAGLMSFVLGRGVAQDGNGVGQPYVIPTQAVIGQPLTITLGAPNVQNGLAAISGALSYGPTVVPGWGTFWLDFSSPSLFHIPMGLDTNGSATAVAFIPNDPSLIFAPPIYLYAAVLDPSLPFPSISVSKTFRIQFDKERRFTPTTNTLATARGSSAVTAMTLAEKSPPYGFSTPTMATRLVMEARLSGWSIASALRLMARSLARWSSRSADL